MQLALTTGVARRAVLVLLPIATLTGCMGGPMGPMHPDMHGPPDDARPRAPAPEAGAPELVIVATEFGFDPDELRIRAAETVNLTLDNRGALYHDLTIADLDLVLTAEAGTRSRGALTVPQPGRYPFVCSVAGHTEAGMTGILVVT